MLNIRRINNADTNLIASLSRQTFYDTFHSQNTEEDMQLFLEENFNSHTVRLEINDPENTFLIAENGGVPVGYAKLSEKTGMPKMVGKKAMEICRIYALKDHIGQGVGSSLMHKCIEIAKEKEKQVIWLGVWEHNERAIKFYESKGFTKFGEHEFILGNDAQNDWLMIKEI